MRSDHYSPVQEVYVGKPNFMSAQIDGLQIAVIRRVPLQFVVVPRLLAQKIQFIFRVKKASFLARFSLYIYHYDPNVSCHHVQHVILQRI